MNKEMHLGVSDNARNSTRHGATIFSRTLSHGVSWMDLGSHRVNSSGMLRRVEQ